MALPTVLLITALVLALLAGVTTGLRRASRGSGLERDAEQAYYAAQSGVQRVAAWSQAWNQDPANTPFGWRDSPPYPSGSSHDLQAEWAGGTARVVARYTMAWAPPPDLGTNGCGAGQLWVQATGTAGRASHTTTACLAWDGTRILIAYLKY